MLCCCCCYLTLAQLRDTDFVKKLIDVFRMKWECVHNLAQLMTQCREDLEDDESLRRIDHIFRKIFILCQAEVFEVSN